MMNEPANHATAPKPDLLDQVLADPAVRQALWQRWRERLGRVTAWLTWLFAGALVLVLAAMEWIGERNWLLAFCLYVPAQMWLLPLGLLAPAETGLIRIDLTIHSYSEGATSQKSATIDLAPVPPQDLHYVVDNEISRMLRSVPHR